MSDILRFHPPGLEGFETALGDLVSRSFPGKARVAAKLHMGEGAHHFDLELTARAISVLKDLGMKPFLFDSPVMYAGERHTPEGYVKRAAENGFTERAIGCSVVVSNESETVRGDLLPIGVCRPLLEADAVLVLSHVKGHPCSGIGGALKNLGMGGVDRKSKGAIHEGAKAVLTGECDGCGSCIEGCPGSALTISRKRIRIDDGACWGCGRCVDVCPNAALESRTAPFDALLADSAAAVISRIRRALYVNDVRKITRLCDCCRNAGPEIAPDVGVLIGTDPVAIDRASVDLILDLAGEDVFLREHGRSPYGHIREAAARGAGSLEYRLVSAIGRQGDKVTRRQGA